MEDLEFVNNFATETGASHFSKLKSWTSKSQEEFSKTLRPFLTSLVNNLA